MNTEIDITFNFASDTPPGKDPDTFSPTLRKYHKHLWSKPLPSGEFFGLSDDVPKSYLCHESALGEFHLASDAITHSYKNTSSLSQVIDQLPEEYVQDLFNSGCTIGAYTLFPMKKIDRKMTINGARGLNHKIKDRFDLTLECIRRHYLGQDNPLKEPLERYGSFFRLFVDFENYVEFFLLQDLVYADYSSIKFHLPFDNFQGSPLPDTASKYRTYHENTLSFIESRNRRIANLN